MSGTMKAAILILAIAFLFFFFWLLTEVCAYVMFYRKRMSFKEYMQILFKNEI